MNQLILERFLADQRKAKAIIKEKLEIPEDIRAMEWAGRHREIRDAYARSPFAEVFRPHGFGLELKIGELHIDYDYSETGRADGFDSWRIYVYMIRGEFDNQVSDEELSESVDQWFQQLIDSGKIKRFDNLYYLIPSSM